MTTTKEERPVRDPIGIMLCLAVVLVAMVKARPMMAIPNRGWVITAQTIAANVLR